MRKSERPAVETGAVAGMDYDELQALFEELRGEAAVDEHAFMRALADLDRLLDWRYPTGAKKRSSVTHLALGAVDALLDVLPHPGGHQRAHSYRLSWRERDKLVEAPHGSRRLAVDATGFPAEGDHSLARCLVEAVRLGWRHVLLYRVRGQRFLGCGLAGMHLDGRIDVYGSPGDYLGSGLDGGKLFVHGSVQDQAGNILKSGKLVVAGDAGQCFLYAAKGGEVFVLGDAAGRPLINAVGSPKVVLNGTALDYLGESFMAGDPLSGGGFVVVNGMRYDLEGRLHELAEPYPGGNLFSLASGGAAYVRDPRGRIGEDQLNGGRIGDFTPLDWEVVRPLLEENERLFGIRVEELLSVDGRLRDPRHVYRKVESARAAALKG